MVSSSFNFQVSSNVISKQFFLLWEDILRFILHSNFLACITLLEVTVIHVSLYSMLPLLLKDGLFLSYTVTMLAFLLVCTTSFSIFEKTSEEDLQLKKFSSYLRKYVTWFKTFSKVMKSLVSNCFKYILCALILPSPYSWFAFVFLIKAQTTILSCQTPQLNYWITLFSNAVIKQFLEHVSVLHYFWAASSIL